MSVFLGITGASGAPYRGTPPRRARRRRRRGRLVVSSAGSRSSPRSSTATPTLDRDEVLRRFVDGRDGVTVHAPNDWRAPYASGSAKVDAYVICPCSMGTAGTIASGTMSNLIHRAASVAIKEGRKLVVVPRETPLSDIHLENLLRLRHAGAVVLLAAPGFYNAPRPSTI